MRLFFALPIPEPLTAALAEWQGRARNAGVAAAYPRPKGMHLTLVFLGAVDEARLPALAEAAAFTAGRYVPLLLQTSGLGVFPPHGAPKVIWLGLEAAPALEALHHELARAVEPLGFPWEDRPFTPHLTLARPKGQGSRPPLVAAPAPFAWTAKELVLYDSVATAGAQRYEVRGRWPLSGSAPLR